MIKKILQEALLGSNLGGFLESAVLSIVMPLLESDSVTFYWFWTGFLVSFFASLVQKLLTPIIDFGQYLTVKLGTNPRTLPYQIVSSFFMTLMMGTFMSLLMTWWAVHNVPNFQSFYWNS